MNENYKDFFPSKEMMEFPSIINLEVFRGKCPCRCIHCPVGRMDVNERKEFYGVEGISQDLYTKIIDEVALHSQSALRIHSVGEPLLWEELRNFVIYANSKNVHFWIHNPPSAYESPFELRLLLLYFQHCAQQLIPGSVPSFFLLLLISHLAVFIFFHWSVSNKDV